MDGAVNGDFLITVISSSIKSLPYISVWLVLPEAAAAVLNVSIFIHLGSFKSSVKNNKPSMIFTPVIKLLVENFNTLFLSIIIGEITSIVWSYSNIPSWLSALTNQYIFSVLSYFITPIVLAFSKP